MSMQLVLALLALYVGLVHSFSWDIVLAKTNQLEFYDEGVLTHTEDIPSPKIGYDDMFSITYDPVHNRVLFANNGYYKVAISSFDITTKKVQLLVRQDGNTIDFAYDPPTETIFFLDKHCISSVSLKSGSNDKVDRVCLNLSSNDTFRHISVDSCGRYIYWITDRKIEKARFDGTEREIVLYLDSTVTQPAGLAIDQQIQKMYWIEEVITNKEMKSTIQSADLNGNNRIGLYFTSNNNSIGPLTVSNDYIYWGGHKTKTYWRLQKTRSEINFFKIVQLPEQFITNSEYCYNCKDIAANYKTQPMQNCEALKPRLPINSVPSDYDSISDTDVSLLCVHGTKVSGKSRCECAQGYSGERCEVPVCHNYCFEGDCSVSAEGHPKCRCKAGYSGNRCEVNACHHEYCLNKGVCSLNAESEPICQCTGDYEGERCDVPVFCIKYFQTITVLKDILNKTDVTPQVTLGKGLKSTNAV